MSISKILFEVRNYVIIFLKCFGEWKEDYIFKLFFLDEKQPNSKFHIEIDFF